MNPPLTFTYMVGWKDPYFQREKRSRIYWWIGEQRRWILFGEISGQDDRIFCQIPSMESRNDRKASRGASHPPEIPGEQKMLYLTKKKSY